MDHQQTRLNILHRLKLLDIDETGNFDRLTQLATRVLDTPVSLITTIDDNGQWCLGYTGLDEPYATSRHMPLSHSFCQHVVANKLPLILEDAREHPTLKHNLAIRDLGAIAYLGIPLITSDNIALGSFCVIDDKRRDWSNDEIKLMIDLSKTVMTEIELRDELHKREEAESLLTEYIREREQLRIAKEMTTALSHDLRTPLSSIGLKVELLERKINDETITGSIQVIQKKLAEINKTLKNFDLLWLSDEAKYDHKQTHSLMHILEISKQYIMNQPYYDDTSITIHIEQSDTDYYINANEQLITVALTNILENALIFNRHQQINVVIAVEQIDKLLRITVTDDGIGIDADDLPYIFNPLFKANKARTESASASGIGLTVAKQIIEEHFGKVKASSDLGIGTQILITLPSANANQIYDLDDTEIT